MAIAADRLSGLAMLVNLGSSKPRIAASALPPYGERHRAELSVFDEK